MSEQELRDAGKEHHHWCGIPGHVSVCRDPKCEKPIKDSACIYCIRSDMRKIGVTVGDAYKP